MLDKKKLLSRDDFRRSVFERDSYKCVICKNDTSIVVHHILERRLFSDGGYYIDNGASLCAEHHIEAEQTVLSCDEIRNSAGITRLVLPDHLYDSQPYDKWGNPILINGQRLKGDLFYDESVQKVLKEGNVLTLFVKYVKYPRTYHVPWSLGMTKDDRMIESTEIFKGKEVIVTVKMDGEQTSMYNDYIHARSIDSSYSGEWRTWAKKIWSNISHEIPKDWRVCCENLQAKHSIEYQNLISYIYLISVWNDKNFCLSWNETEEWAELLGIPIVPVIYKGSWDEELIKNLYTEEFEGNSCEGYVVRISDRFYYSEFRNSCAKFVRKDHVNSSRHWRYERIKFNSLKKP